MQLRLVRSWCLLAAVGTILAMGACGGGEASQVQPGAGGASASSGGTGGCPKGLTDCNGTCVATDLDPANCGKCGNACDKGEICSSGKCAFECGGGTTECGGACIDTNLDPKNCGDCDVGCAPGEVCSAGKCGLQCVGGTTKCGNECVDTELDAKHCGGCGKACAQGEVCSAEKCGLECVGGTTLCGGKCVDLQSHLANCGSCGKICGPGEVCSAGKCGLECVGGTTKCGAKCVDTGLDTAHCGGCDLPCGPGEACSLGQCALFCGGSTTKCGGDCVNVQSDAAHCGGCGKACPPGEVCSGGVCGVACGGGTTKCGNACVNLQTDPANCGGCGVACGQGNSCVAGKCVLQCGGGTTKCGEQCVDLQSDAANCGSCGNACQQNWACVAGKCALQCGGGTTACGDKCVDLQSDPANCGGCAKACQPGEVCVAAKCSLQCGGGTTKCGNLCVNLQTDPKNCGQCDKVCLQDQICTGGKCVLVCGPGLSECNSKCVDLKADDNNCGSCGNVCSPGVHCVGGLCGVLCGNQVCTPGQNRWSMRFGDGDEQHLYHIATDSQRNVLFTGDFQQNLFLGGDILSTSATYYNVFLAKLDPTGKHLWSKGFGDGTSHQYGWRVRTDSKDNVILFGYFRGSIDFGGGALVASTGNWDLFLAKFDSTGKHLWSKQYGDGTYDQVAWGLAIDAADSIIVSGYFRGTLNLGGGNLSAGTLSYDAFVGKLDANGTHKWSKSFGSNSYDQIGGDVDVDKAGNVYLSGYFYDTIAFGGPSHAAATTYYDVFLAKFDTAGTYKWSKDYGDGWHQLVYGMDVDPSGNIALAGIFRGSLDFGAGAMSAPINVYRAYVASIDTNGTAKFSRPAGDSVYNAYARAVAIDSWGNVVATGFHMGTVNWGCGNLAASASYYDAYAVKLDKFGNCKWSVHGGDHTSHKYGYAVAIDSIDVNLLGGAFAGTFSLGGSNLVSQGGYDIYLVQLAP
ncbi:MAG: hypothetical protein HY744_24280 [Deltaproteobacteria bacterium]|nr:hypothetical protein [Deltaproteobacteria bacterium]